VKKILFQALAVVSLFVAGCKSGSSEDPKQVLTSFFKAVSSKNMDAAKKYVTKDSEGMLGMLQMGMNNVPDSAGIMFNEQNLDMGNAVITGDKATIPVKEKRSGEETEFVLKKENGSWKVAFDKSTLMEMAQKKMKEHGFNQLDSMQHNGDENINIDSLQHKLNNLSPEEKEHAAKLMDSAAKVLKDLQKTQP
jgi:Domain of unknown function (DUF4878)